MYPVSSAYIEAIAQPVRDFKIAVTFKYADGTQATFDDHDIVTGSDVIIESQAVSGSASSGMIDVGAVPTATASLAIIEDDTNLHRYAGAEYNISVSLKLGSGEYEPVNMGTFYVDISKTSRIGNKIEVFGYDAMPSLMYDISGLKAELKGMTASNAVRRMVSVSMVKCKFTQDLSSLPNYNLPLDFSSTQIVTARDAIMWIAQLMGCFARINRYNYLEFVPIKSNWVWYNDDHTSGTIGAARLILGAQRYETKFSDDRIHICGLSMPGKDGYTYTYKREGLESDSNVIINLEQNPLITSSETSTSTILNAILDQLSTTYFYAFRSEIINDPALDAGDTIRLEGGSINGTNHNEDLIGFITHNTWRYRGGQTVVNTGHIAIGYEGTSSNSNIVPAASQAIKAVQENINKIASTTPGGGGSSVQADRDRLIAPSGDTLVYENYSYNNADALIFLDDQGIIDKSISCGGDALNGIFLVFSQIQDNGGNIRFNISSDQLDINMGINGSSARFTIRGSKNGALVISYQSANYSSLRELSLAPDSIQYRTQDKDKDGQHTKVYMVPLTLISGS